METQNRQILLAKRPVGMAKLEDFEFRDTPLPELAPGAALVRTRYISLEPAMRGWMNEGRSFIEHIDLGEVVRAQGTAEVISSKTPLLGRGDIISGTVGLQTHAMITPDDVVRLDLNQAPEPTWLSVLGMPGLTAYFGMLDIGKPQAGETVLVSAAAGAVGSVVGQIAKLKGARVVGIAGGTEKCEIAVKSFGFDACIDYRLETKLTHAIHRACPDGVDIYFDNVGGDILDAALRCLNRSARVVLCGSISSYNSEKLPPGPQSYLSLLVNRARMEGFIVYDYKDKFDMARKELVTWMQAGHIAAKEHIVTGLEHAVEALNMLYTGGNFGKLILQIERDN